jgi:hypothetical protein
MINEKPKSKPKTKAKVKVKVKTKEHETKKTNKVIVEIEKTNENSESLYNDKLKHLLFKIKNQNNFTDTRIRFGWK